MLKDFPWLSRVKTDDWDFFLTIAFVFVAMTQLEHEGLPQSRVDAIIDIVTASFTEWQPDALGAFDDCKAFYEQGSSDQELRVAYAGDQARFHSADVIAMWLVWNLLKRRATEQDELRVARERGSIAAHEFTKWWRS